MKYDYSFQPQDEEGIKNTRRWLLLAVLALAVSGIVPLVLLAGRASMFAEKGVIKEMFHQVLVVHVDLSVLAWFLAIACMLFSAIGCVRGRFASIPYLGRGGVWAFGAGGLLIALSPAHPDGEALMSNYIPVITNPLFFMGLALILSGLALSVLKLLLDGLPEGYRLRRCFSPSETSTMPAIVYGVFTTAIILWMGFSAFLQTHKVMPPHLSGVDYYELLFWAGGHVIQFAYLQMLMIAWLMIASAIGAHTALKPFHLIILFTFNLVLCLITPLPFLRYPITSFEFLDFFTQIMRHGGGVTSFVVGLYILVSLIKLGWPTKETRVLWMVLFMSFLLFGVGGGLGYMIEGSNTIIPAHYHGSIIGTSLAFMGVIYIFLPKLGYGKVTHMKVAFWQPILLGIGQLMHIIGFARAGGYGVQRKTVGGLDDALSQAEFALQVMRVGGLIAIIGGLLFIVVVIRSVRNKQALHSPQ